MRVGSLLLVLQVGSDSITTLAVLQDELTKNRCRSKSIDVWQRGVDTGRQQEGRRNQSASLGLYDCSDM